MEVQGELGGGPTGTCIRENRAVVNDDFAAQFFPGGNRPALRLPRLGRSLRCQGKRADEIPRSQAFDGEQVGLLASAEPLIALDHDRSASMPNTIEATVDRFTTRGFALHELLCDAEASRDFRFLKSIRLSKRRPGEAGDAGGIGLHRQPAAGRAVPRRAQRRPTTRGVPWPTVAGTRCTVADLPRQFAALQHHRAQAGRGGAAARPRPPPRPPTWPRASSWPT